MFDRIKMFKTDNRIASSYFVKFIVNRTRKTVKYEKQFLDFGPFTGLLAL